MTRTGSRLSVLRGAGTAALLAALGLTLGPACGDDGTSGNENVNYNENHATLDAGADAAPPADAEVVDDPLCPLGLTCQEVLGGEMGCLDQGEVPAGTIRGCAEPDGPDCPDGSRCLYLDAAETESACVTFCGACPDPQTCSDVTGSGTLACVQNGGVPPGATTGCYETGACPPNETCFYYADTDPIESFCLARCSPCREGTCPEGEVCNTDTGVCEEAPCTPGSCPQGELCVEGRCVPDAGPGPGPGPGPDCVLPELECTGTADYCGELIPFDPDNNPDDPSYDPGLGYVDYPENGETWQNQYRSYLRRDVVMAIQYAAAKTACKTAAWTFGNGGPVGLIDMSEADGSIPGTSVGQPGHPQGTHTNGFDIDIAYYQTNTANNRARPVCDHLEGGSDAYHCTAPPHLLDPWRTAFFIAAVAEHPALRVVGVDGKVGPAVEAALAVLCNEGWLSGLPCNGGLPLAYEETDQGYGWYLFHHHHMHVSFNQPSYAPRRALGGPDAWLGGLGELCLVPGCDRAPLESFLRSLSTPGRAPRILRSLEE